MGHDVFISHSSKDKVFADAVCATLERNGIKCWVAPRDVPLGMPWASSIVNAIASSKAMLLVFSRNAQSSSHVCREVERAAHHGMPIAPVRVEDVLPAGDLEFFLSSAHWMDAIKPPFETHLNELAQKVKDLLKIRWQGDGSSTTITRGEPPAPAAVEPSRPR